MPAWDLEAWLDSLGMQRLVTKSVLHRSAWMVGATRRMSSEQQQPSSIAPACKTANRATATQHLSNNPFPHPPPRHRLKFAGGRVLTQCSRFCGRANC